MSISIFNTSKKIEKEVMEYIKNDPEIKEQAEKLQFLILKRYMQDKNIEW